MLTGAAKRRVLQDLQKELASYHNSITKKGSLALFFADYLGIGSGEVGYHRSSLLLSILSNILSKNEAGTNEPGDINAIFYAFWREKWGPTSAKIIVPALLKLLGIEIEFENQTISIAVHSFYDGETYSCPMHLCNLKMGIEEVNNDGEAVFLGINKEFELIYDPLGHYDHLYKFFVDYIKGLSPSDQGYFSEVNYKKFLSHFFQAYQNHLEQLESKEKSARYAMQENLRTKDSRPGVGLGPY